MKTGDLEIGHDGAPSSNGTKSCVALSDLQLFVSFLGHAERPQLAP
jgi:hypothetical protein